MVYNNADKTRTPLIWEAYSVDKTVFIVFTLISL